MSRARDVADVQDNLGGAVAPYVAGKNAVINGGMDIWQRGTSVSTLGGYSADRWYILSGASATVTRSTAKTTPNSQYMMLMTASGTQQIFALQAIETLNAIYYAGKTVTLSAYAAGLTTTTNLNMALQYSTNVDEGVMGAGWTATTFVSGNPDLTLSSTVTRFSATYSIPSTAKSLRVQIVNNAANITVGQGIYLGDVQLEQGSVATPFSRAGGSIGGELALCQRYYFRTPTGSAQASSYMRHGSGAAFESVRAGILVQMPVPLRVLPSSVDFANLALNRDVSVAHIPVTAIALESAVNGSLVCNVYCTVASGLTTGTRYELENNGNSSGYIGFNAEL